MLMLLNDFFGIDQDLEKGGMFTEHGGKVFMGSISTSSKHGTNEIEFFRIDLPPSISSTKDGDRAKHAVDIIKNPFVIKIGA